MKEINKKIYYNHDDEIVSYMTDEYGIIYPVKRGAIRQAPKFLLIFLWKSILFWVYGFGLMFLIAFLVDGWHGVEMVYTGLYYIFGSIYMIFEGCFKLIYRIWELSHQ